MPRSLYTYGVEEFGDFVLDDPALFDSIVVRMLEDIELAAYTIAREHGELEIDIVVVKGATDALGIPLPGTEAVPPDESLRNYVRDVARSPLAYTDEAIDRIAQIANSAVLNFLRVGATVAQDEGSRHVGLRHFLPAYEKWPYPLNRFC
jgi:hypothetical protein